MTPPPANNPAEPAKTAGERLVDEMAQPKDSYSVRMLIEQAADLADLNEKLRRLIRGELAEWVSLKLGPQVVQVIIDDPVKRWRENGTQIRQLLAEIHRQRVDIPMDPNDDGDPLSKY